MQDAIDKYFDEILSQPSEIIYNEINRQRLKGQTHIALEITKKFKAAHGSNSEISLIEKSLIKDSGDQQKILSHWISNSGDVKLYPKGILSSREGLTSAISLQKSLISAITALMNDAINFACEISLLVRDDYSEYLILRNILAAEAKRLDLTKYENHVAIFLVCEQYDKSTDKEYTNLLGLLNTAQPWQIARILRPHKLTKNATLVRQITDEIIGKQVPIENLTDLQKINLLVIAYPVVSHDVYRSLCERFARQVQVEGRNGLTGWKLTWSMASINGQQPIDANRPPADRTRKLRIAVCVSGQLRGFKDAKATWSLLGLNDHDTDYYVHTWKNVGVRFPDPAWKGHVERRFSDASFVDSYIRMCAQYGIATITEMYPSIFSTKAAGLIAIESEIKDAYGKETVTVIDDESDERFRNFTNQDKMFYKISECFKLAEKSGKEYDLVIRIRPDIKMKEGTKVDWHSLYERSLADRVSFNEAPASLKENIWVGDQFGAACFEVAKRFASTYEFHDYAIKQKISGVPAVRSGHATLAWSLLCQGVKVEQLTQIKWGGLSDVQKLNNFQIKELIEKDIGNKGSNIIHQEFLSSLRGEEVER